jgi:Zn-dependent peptidase ImmA (M78 family)/transcriptional regulator with XRE-family HTH domain
LTEADSRPEVRTNLEVVSAAQFSKRRLRLARESRGFTQRELATKTRLTAAAVSQFESGAARPSPSTLEDLARAVGFPPDFFARPTGASVGEELHAYFRSLRSTSAADRRRARARAQLLCYFTRVLERYVRLPALDLPRHAVKLSASREEVEQVAGETRSAWQLACGPLDHMVRCLERHGIVAARFPVDSTRVDAFSVPFPDRPILVLGSDKSDRGRSKFDAAHELGHLVMHEQEGSSARAIETQAQWFAAALLMPADDIRPQLPTDPDWQRLFELKRHWGVSIAALLLRARTLGVMTEHTYIQSMKTMSARGWRRSEPGYLGAPEMPVVLGRAIQLAEERGSSLADLARDAQLPLDEVREFVGAGSDPRPTVNV